MRTLITFHVFKTLQAEFFEKYGKRLVPILISTGLKVVRYGHHYALMSVNQSMVAPHLSEIPHSVLHFLLKLSGKTPFQTKDSKTLFQAHIPEEVRERLKQWNSALPIDPAHKQKFCSQSVEDMQINVCMESFLGLHFTAFAGSRTFDPSRSLKSVISSLLSLLYSVTELNPAESADMICSLFPLGCDALMEFAHAELLKLIELSGEKTFSLECMKYQIAECFRLVQLPGMQDCSLLGPVLADFFAFLSSILENSSNWAVLSLLDDKEPSTGQLDSGSCSSVAVSHVYELFTLRQLECSTNCLSLISLTYTHSC